MDTDELLARFAVALGIGLLIGLERGWRARDEKPGSRAAGFRTFAISGLLGGVVGALAHAAGGAATAGGGAVIGIALAAFAAVMTVFCLEENRADKNFSATTAIAAILTFALGAYALLGDMRVAAAVAVVAAGSWRCAKACMAGCKSLTWPELRSGLILLAMTFIALPVVPDDPVGPFGGVNPREIWLIAIVLAGVSFLGYAAVKYFGERHGVLLAAAAGGLVSSTAVTLRQCAARGSRRGLAAIAGGRRVAGDGSVVRARARHRRRAAGQACWCCLRRRLPLRRSWPSVLPSSGSIGAQDEDSEQTAVKFRNPFGFWSVIGLALSMGVDHPARALPRPIFRVGRRRSSVRRRSGCSTSMR